MKLKATTVGVLLAVLPLVGAAPLRSLSTPVPATAVQGEYVEVRTASVFAGACHYNGERVTDGRSAVLAFSIDGGAFAGVDLTGVRAVAVVTCDENLAEVAAPRRSEIRVDADTDAKANAAVAWLKARPGRPLGDVTRVERSAVTFRHSSDTFAVLAAGLATLAVRPMPDAACCSQPQLVWYSPLVLTETRRVGFTESASCSLASAAWQRADENSAFYGRLAAE